MRGPSADPFDAYPLPQEIADRIHLGVGCAAPHDAAVSARLHSWLLGYGGKRVPSASPYYLYRQRAHRFSINWVDVADPRYFEFTGVAVWRRLLDWLDNAYEAGHRISIRCDKGQSRSPSVAATWLARKGWLDSSSFDAAIVELAEDYYHHADPGAGISSFLADNWAAVQAPSGSGDNSSVQTTNEETARG